MSFALLTHPKILFIDDTDAEFIQNTFRDWTTDLTIVTFKKKAGFISLEEILATQSADDVARFQCTPITSPDAPAMIIFSSGTTAGPKGVVLPYGALARATTSIPPAQRANHTCMILTSVPWVIFIVYFLEATLSLGTIILSNSPNDETYKAIEKYKVRREFITFDLLNRHKVINLIT